MTANTTVTSTNTYQVDVNQLVSQLEELHPLDFRLAFGLTHEEAAIELCLEPQTMRAYSKNNPSKRVRRLAATIAKRWLSGERQLIDAQYLINPRYSNSLHACYR